MQTQPGFFDITERTNKLTQMGDPLPGLNVQINWEAFRGNLNRIHNKRSKLGGERSEGGEAGQKSGRKTPKKRRQNQHKKMSMPVGPKKTRKRISATKATSMLMHRTH